MLEEVYAIISPPNVFRVPSIVKPLEAKKEKSAPQPVSKNDNSWNTIQWLTVTEDPAASADERLRPVTEKQSVLTTYYCHCSMHQLQSYIRPIIVMTTMKTFCWSRRPEHLRNSTTDAIMAHTHYIHRMYGQNMRCRVRYPDEYKSEASSNCHTVVTAAKRVCRLLFCHLLVTECLLYVSHSLKFIELSATVIQC